MEIIISLLGQKAYEAAIKKYGQNFADAVIDKEAQLHVDNIEYLIFEEYAEYEWMQEFIKPPSGKE